MGEPLVAGTVSGAGAGYLQLGRQGRRADPRFRHDMHSMTPPSDRFGLVYMAMVLAGVGFLLPYNSFIIAVDYFQARFPGSTIVFDMSLVYILTAFLAVLLSNLLVEALSLDVRITFGYVLSFITLLFVTTCEIWWELFEKVTSYHINLIAIAVVAFGCTVQQSSFYGYTGMLPSRYTQAVMAGESAAGFLVSLNRIVTKLLLKDDRLNTLLFFALSALLVGMCCGLYHAIRRSPFVQFYLQLCAESGGEEGGRIVLQPAEDVDILEQNDSRKNYGVLELDTSNHVNNATLTSFPPPDKDGLQSFANPVYEPTTQTLGDNGTTYKVEEEVVRMRGHSFGGSYSRSVRVWAAIKRGIAARHHVTQVLWPYMLSIALAYFVTLCLYPGIESEIISCRLGSWMPVLLMAVFNAADLVGKVVASVPLEWSRRQLVLLAALRLALVPLMLLCAAPRAHPALPGEGWAVLLSLLLGASNGLLGSVPMILAPSRVPEEHRELAGNIMTLSYNIGLTTGSAVAYLLDAILGTPLANPCGLEMSGQLPNLTSLAVESTTAALATKLPEVVSTSSSLLTSTAYAASKALLTTMTTTLRTTSMPKTSSIGPSTDHTLISRPFEYVVAMSTTVLPGLNISGT